jgi:hypothetical protein
MKESCQFTWCDSAVAHGVIKKEQILKISFDGIISQKFNKKVVKIGQKF